MIPLDSRHLYAGVVYDALRTIGLKDDEILLPDKIRPLDSQSSCYGPVYLCMGRRVEPGEDYAELDRIRLDMWKSMPSKHVVVLATHHAGEWHPPAHSGDITSLIYRKVGALGFVTDGLVRDSQRIVSYGLPCFCRGTTPIDAKDRWALTHYGKVLGSVFLDGHEIERTDWLFGDVDGVLRIPEVAQTEFERVVQDRRQHEEHVRNQVQRSLGRSAMMKRLRQCYEKGRW